MSMSKKDFIALAETLAEVRTRVGKAYNEGNPYTDAEIETIYEWSIADFCARQNPRFMRDRWLGYINGENGPNGGGVKAPKSYAVQGNYGQGWETVCTENNRKEALMRLREYRENETQYSHRIVRE